jgi:hypothetical protein
MQMGKCYCPHCNGVHEIEMKQSAAHGLANLLVKVTGKAALHGAGFVAGAVNQGINDGSRSELMQQGYTESQADEILHQRGSSSVTKHDQKSGEQIINESEESSYRPHCSNCQKVLTYIGAPDRIEYLNTVRGVKKSRGLFNASVIAFMGMAMIGNLVSFLC